MSSYERVNWKNAPDTPTDAEHFNIMDKGIEDAHNGANTPIFETFDDKGQETLMEADPIVPGDTMALIIAKITKYTNNVRYLVDLLNEGVMREAGYYQVGNAIADLAKKLEPNFAYMWHSGNTVLVNTHIPFKDHVIVGDAFSYNNGKVTVETDDVSYVRISATVSGSEDNAQRRGWIKIYRERDGAKYTVAEALQYNDSFCSPSVLAICKAQKGDIFYVFIPNDEQFNVCGGGLQSFFNVEKIC